MESKEKCEQIINMFNNQTLPGAKEPLLVKFADGGQKKRSPFRNDNRMWREATEVNTFLTRFIYFRTVFFGGDRVNEPFK